MNLFRIQRKIREEIAKIGDKEGVRISLSGVFPNLSIRIETEFDDVSNLRSSKKNGFTQNIVGMEFIWSESGSKYTQVGTKLRVMGFSPRRKKYTISCQHLDGVKVGLSVDVSPEYLKRMLGGDVQINRTSNLGKLL